MKKMYGMCKLYGVKENFDVIVEITDKKKCMPTVYGGYFDYLGNDMITGTRLICDSEICNGNLVTTLEDGSLYDGDLYFIKDSFVPMEKDDAKKLLSYMSKEQIELYSKNIEKAKEQYFKASRKDKVKYNVKTK